MSDVPKVGDEIYVPTSRYLSHGVDDKVGGLATVKSVRFSKGSNTHFVAVNEVSGEYNWENYLASRQKELEEMFGNQRAFPDPDDRPEFNQWD